MTVVKSWIEENEVAWAYPGIEGEVRMKRTCEMPPDSGTRTVSG